MADGENIGRVSVEVTPEFDQAELFRQVRAATKKLPKLTLKPEILAKDVNAAIREVNKKKLVALRLPVTIATRDVNAAIKKANAGRMAALKPPVQITVREANKAIREVNRKKLIPLTVNVKINTREISSFTREITKTNRETDKATRGIGQFAANIVVLRSAFSLVRISAIGTAFGFLAQAISSAATAATTLGAAVAPALAGGLVAAGGGALALAQGMGVLKLSTEGVRDALGGANGLNKQLDPEKLAALTPAARDFALQLERLKPLARGVQQALQEQLFGGLSEALRIVTPLVDDLVVPLQGTADVLGDVAVNAARAAATISGDLTRTMTVNNIILRNLGDSAVDYAVALSDILVVAGPFLVLITSQTRALAANVREYIRNTRESGKLGDVLVTMSASLSLIVSIGKSAGRVLFNVFAEALPFGILLLSQIDGVVDRLARLTSSAEGRAGMKAFFAASLPTIEEFGRLIRDIGIEFVKLGQQPGLLLLLQTLRTELLPVLSEVIGKLTSEFGPVLVTTFASLALLFSDLAGATGPLRLLVETVGNLALAAHLLVQEHPGLLRVVGAFFLLESVLAAVAIQSFIFRASRLGFVIGFLTQALVGARGLVPSLTALGNILRTGAGLGRFLGVLGLIITGVFTVTRFFDQLFQNLRNGIPTTEAFARAFSTAILSAVQDVLRAIVAVSEGLLKLTGAFSLLPGPTGKAFEVFGKVGIKNIKSLDKQIQGLKSTVEATKPPKVFGPPLPADLKAMQEFDKITAAAQRRMQKSQKDIAAEQAKVFGGITEVGIPATDALKQSTDAATGAIDRQRSSLDLMKVRLEDYGTVLERQRTLVDTLKSAIDELKNAQLSGTKAFSDARFSIDQQIKSLELQQVNLKIGGAADEDPALKALQDQINALQLQAQKVDLSESLQLDPLRRQFEQTVNPIKEITFTNAIKQFQALSKQHEVESTRLAAMQGHYNRLSAAVERMDRSVQRASNNLKTSSTSLGQAVSAPQIIQKPLARANEALTQSNKAITQNVTKAREGLRKPFRDAAMDINRIFTRIPEIAAPGAGAAIVWFHAIGLTMGKRFVGGLMEGMRSFLVEGSPFHKLLHEEIPEFIRKNKGPVSFDQTILVPAGVAIMQGLTTGLRRGFEPVKGYLNQVGPSMEEYVPDSLFGKRTAEFLVDVAAGKKPNPNEFFKDLVPDAVPITGGIVDPRLGFLHKSLSLADTTQMAASLAKTFGVAVTSVFRPGAITSSGNLSDHGFGLAADLSNGNRPTPQMDALAAALKPLFGSIVKQLIWRNKDQNRGFPVSGHMNHVHVAFLPGKGFSLHSGKKGKPALSGPFAALFAAAAQAHGVPASLLQAVAKAESGFNPRAGSPAGAKGLMQLMPATFASLNVGSNIFDPKQNIFAGAKYLARQIKTFKNISLALAAYNAGPGNARLALGSFGETIAYVARVLRFLKDFGGFRALGGPVSTGKSFVVGERGPELFMPRRNGQIISNKDLVEMVSLLREIKDTGGLRQQTTNIQTASQDPVVLAEMMEIRRKRRLARIR